VITATLFLFIKIFQQPGLDKVRDTPAYKKNVRKRARHKTPLQIPKSQVQFTSLFSLLGKEVTVTPPSHLTVTNFLNAMIEIL